MKLMDKNRLKLMSYQNQTKDSSVMNDFHSPKTNGGYSRSKTGGLYYKWDLFDFIWFSIICFI